MEKEHLHPSLTITGDHGYTVNVTSAAAGQYPQHTLHVLVTIATHNHWRTLSLKQLVVACEVSEVAGNDTFCDISPVSGPSCSIVYPMSTNKCNRLLLYKNSIFPSEINMYTETYVKDYYHTHVT